MAWKQLFVIGLKVTNYLLNRQIRHFEQDFIRHGGLREAMTRIHHLPALS